MHRSAPIQRPAQTLIVSNIQDHRNEEEEGTTDNGHNVKGRNVPVGDSDDREQDRGSDHSGQERWIARVIDEHSYKKAQCLNRKPQQRRQRSDCDDQT